MVIADIESYRRIRAELWTLEQRLGAAESAGNRPSNVNGLIAVWDQFGPAFGSGDATLLEDYVHFLFVRDRIQKFIEAASDESQAYLAALVMPTDRAFESATVDDDRLARMYREASGWWWRRIPKDPGATIAESLTRRTGDQPVGEG